MSKNKRNKMDGLIQINNVWYGKYNLDNKTLIRCSKKVMIHGKSEQITKGYQFRCGYPGCLKVLDAFPTYSGPNKDCEPSASLLPYAQRKAEDSGWSRSGSLSEGAESFKWMCPEHSNHMSNNKTYSIPVVVFPFIRGKEWYILTPEQIDKIKTADDLLRKAKEKLKPERRPDMIIYDEVAEFTKGDMDQITKVKESIDRRNKRRSEELLGPLFSDEVGESKSSEKPDHTLESVINSLNELEHSLLWGEIQGEITTNSQAERWRQRFLIARDNYRIESEKLKEVFNHTGELMTELGQKEQSIIRKDKEIDRLHIELEEATKKNEILMISATNLESMRRIENQRLRKDLETLRLRIAGLGIGIDWEMNMPNDNRINLGVDMTKEDTYIGLAKETIGKVVGEVSEVIKLEDSDGNVIESFKNG